jgi:hypothetical protein
VSFESTTHPVGTDIVTPSFDAIGPLSETGDAMGLGDPAGVGLGTSAVMLPVTVPALFKSAIAVPHPAINTTRPTTPAMINTQGERCTAGWGAPATGA